MKDRLVVAFSCDEKYSRIMAVSIVSLFEHNKQFDEIVVYVLENKVSKESIIQIQKISKSYNRQVEFVDILPLCEKYRFWEQNEDSRYIRLILPEIIHENKVLYLDCDVLIKKNLTELWYTSIEDYAQAAVLDTVRREARAESGIGNDGSYYNSGVLLINLEYWRTHNVIDLFRIFKKKNSNKGIYRDQRVINGVLAEKTLRLGPSYNFTPEMEMFTSKQIMHLTGTNWFYSDLQLKQASESPAIIHFAGRSIDRPWYKNCENKYTSSYREIMTKFDFTNFILWKDSSLNMIKWWIRKRVPYCFLYVISRSTDTLKRNRAACTKKRKE